VTKIGQLEPELDKFLVEGLKLLKIEIDKLAHQILAAKSDHKKHGKTRELKNIRINVFGVKGFGTAKNITWEANNSEVYRALAAANIIHSNSAWISAHEALSENRFPHALKEYLRAEKFLSSARTLVGLKKVHSALASSRADLRHISTKGTRANAIKFWNKKCRLQDSSQEAAGRLYGVIKWSNGEDVPYRTLAKWIAEEKRKLRDKTHELPPLAKL